MQILKQGVHQPLKQYEEVITLVAALAKVFVKLPLKRVKECQLKLLSYFAKNCPLICSKLESERVLTPEIKEEIINNAKNFVESYIGE